jgi:capsular exopolysaccharide synthesis family protein
MAPVSQAKPADSATIHDYLEMLGRRKWLAIGVFLGVVGLVVLSIVRTTPVFEARATMMVLARSGDDILTSAAGAAFGRGRPNLANHITLVQSRGMAEKVAERLPDSLMLSAGNLQPMITARPVGEADAIQLAVSAPSAEAAIAVVNAFLETYEQYDLDQSRTDVSAVRQFVDDQLAVVKTRLDSSELDLEQFKAANKLTNLDAETQALIGRRSEFAAQYQQAAVDAEGSRTELANIKSQIEQEGKGMADVEGISSPLVSNLRNTLSQLEVEKTNLIIRGFGEKSAQILGLNRQIDSTRARLKTEAQTLIAQQGFVDPVGRLSRLFESALTIGTGLDVARAKRTALAAALAKYDASLALLPTTERMLAGLTRDVETDRRVLALLSERREEARIQEVGRTSSVRIIDRSRSASQTRPDIPRSTSFGLMLALALALGSVWLVEYLDTSVRSPEELERRGFPVLAGIPQFGKTGPRRRRREELVSRLITHPGTKPSDAEAFRMLRTSLSFSAVDRPLKTIAVTSAVPGEGKSTVATNLAAVIAQAGWRVLLVDADLRHPALHGVFNRERKPGLTDLIISGDAGDGVIAGTTIDRLSFLPSGTTPPSPADLIISPSTTALLERVSGEFDYVIVDTAPVLVAADTPILASLVDATIVVVRAGRTALQAVENTRAALLNTGARLAGFVLNGIDPSGRRGRYYYYYKYHYYHLPEETVKKKVTKV